MEENRRGALAVRESLERSPLHWNGILEKTVHIPKVYDEETIGHFRQITEISHRIFARVIREYREQADYRRLFPFSKELEDLILLPVPYDGSLPIMRMDLFYHEDTGDFQFCEICDLRSLKYRDGALYSETGRRIDAVYRRAVTADIMTHYSESTDFLRAVRDDAVFIAGAFPTQIIHSKWLFYILHHDRTKSFLTEEERAFVEAHVPLTLEFSKEYISQEEVLENKDRFILKPMDTYASKGIYAAGREHTDREWGALVRELYGKGYICQKYCRQYMTENIDFAWGDGQWHPYLNMPGLYVYNGIFRGILMRTACGESIITAHENERTVPAFAVKAPVRRP